MASLLAVFPVQGGSLVLPRMIGLYVHIPFCHARCGYCDFATYAGIDDKKDEYLSALIQDVQLQPRTQVHTLFIGGGTPTTLSPVQINRLLLALRSHFDFSSLDEATVEANPESASEFVLRSYRDQGVNRLSFGLQTTQNTLLKAIDRLHTFEEFKVAYERARSLGFSNINIDLIYGLPGQTHGDWKKTLAEVLALNPDHVSAYALKVEPHTKFSKAHVPVDDDIEADMYLWAADALTQAGYVHYEISNFAKPGRESRHNLKYWRNENTIGVGLSSASFMNGVRTTNTRNINDYIRVLQNGDRPALDTVTLNPAQSESENIMLALRLNKGVQESQIQRQSSPLFKKFLQNKLALVEKGMYRLTPQGWLLSNVLFEQLV